ncbi:unnamed protein product [Cylicocyclus nassatus]|uniref:Uncharacterized protein n=1 Tax=Cylicocyclus nassatus TaxID=53992 RepID=A0AA36DLZ2_CYLNA|nr:unnamed protein product [Cylicocyclus nassatus]
MANVRLLGFSYTYAITERDDPTADMPKEVEDSMQQVKLGATGAYMPTPVPPEDRSNDPQSDAMADTPASTSSAAIPLREIERVLPIYLRVYYKEDDKTKRSIIEYEVKNTETLIEMLSVMLRKLKYLKGKPEAKGRMYFAQRKFRNPAELDFKRHASTVIEDLSQMEKSLFFVFDMAGRLDAEEPPEENVACWTVPLRK